jgi:UDP-N-acetylglucosamine diphosphorylase/glucosamine-1-phosphate N-acetyltransferase
MPPHLILFEDETCAHLEPLSLTRPVYDLRVGLLTIREQWERALGCRRASGILRPSLRGLFPSPRKPASETLWVNARYLPTLPLIETMRGFTRGHVRCGDDLVAIRSDGDDTRAWLETGCPEPCGRARDVSDDTPRLVYPWDIMRHAPKAIVTEATAVGFPAGRGPLCHVSAIVDRPDQLFMHATAVVEAGAILIADEGPILLDEGARVMAGAMVRGPVAVGAHATVRMGARIYGGTVVGPWCKVGGEVAASVFHSYSNKAHEGYVGNSVIGQWVNLGADTTASNLKMTYGTVKMLDWPTGVEVDTGEQFVGAIIADHCKTGINSMLNTGTVCGVSSIILGAGFPARAIASFKWVQPWAVTDYRLDKALLDMERMMARRGVPLTPPYRRMMTAIYQSGRG